ncbi:unnamed protein product [Fusarium graminearum]|nr:unnamed protein product [Fusarium graminearum]VTO83966.1 unnamed protein product [Fusarium graminearum]
MTIKEESSSQCIERVYAEISQHRETNGTSRDDATRKLESNLVWKLDIRILPICALIYLLCFLDRANIGNARTLNADVGNDLVSTLGMSQFQYIMALMSFLIAYTLFEVPSNFLLKKTSPSTWLAFLMLCFGALTMSIGASRSFATITALRFMLGMFEAGRFFTLKLQESSSNQFYLGVFPGLVYYITFWYKGNERSIRVAVFFASATLAGAFGGVLAYGIGRMNQVCGLEGWRWLFILEGMLSVVASVGVYFFLPDYPETASWLYAEEKSLASLRLQGSNFDEQGTAITWKTAKATLCEGRLWIHYLIFFLASPPFSSFSLFAPSITAGLGYSGLRGQLMTVPPYAVAYVSMMISSYLADKFNARGIVASIAALIGGAGYLASALLPPTSYTERFGCLILAACGTFSSVPPLLGWLAGNTTSSAMASLAIALNISVAAPGQITGIWIYKRTEAEKGYPTGHYTNAACLILLSILSFCLMLYYRRRNAKMVRNGAERRFFYL